MKITVVKNTFGITCRLDMAEERICELQNTSIGSLNQKANIDLAPLYMCCTFVVAPQPLDYQKKKTNV